MTRSAEDSYMSSRSTKTLKYKIIFIGDQFTGKTSIINRFMYDKFYTQHNVVYVLIIYGRFI